MIRLFALFMFCQLVPVIAFGRGLWACITGNRARVFEICKGYDLLANPSFNGQAGEYISARAQRGQKEGSLWACRLCRFLDRVDPGHCKKYD